MKTSTACYKKIKKCWKPFLQDLERSLFAVVSPSIAFYSGCFVNKLMILRWEQSAYLLVVLNTLSIVLKIGQIFWHGFENYIKDLLSDVRDRVAFVDSKITFDKSVRIFLCRLLRRMCITT